MAYESDKGGVKGGKDLTADPKKPVWDNKEGNYTRDDSGGVGASPYNAKFGDGGKVTKSA